MESLRASTSSELQHSTATIANLNEQNQQFRDILSQFVGHIRSRNILSNQQDDLIHRAEHVLNNNSHRSAASVLPEAISSSSSSPSSQRQHDQQHEQQASPASLSFQEIYDKYLDLEVKYHRTSQKVSQVKEKYTRLKARHRAECERCHELELCLHQIQEHVQQSRDGEVQHPERQPQVDAEDFDDHADGLRAPDVGKFDSLLADPIFEVAHRAKTKQRPPWKI